MRFDADSRTPLWPKEVAGRDALGPEPPADHVPPGAVLSLGHIVGYRLVNDRPVVGMQIHCFYCECSHVYPWRHDWGLGLDLVSVRTCPWSRQPIAIRLAAWGLAGSEETWLTATALYDEWQRDGGSPAGWKRRRSRREAEANRPTAADPLEHGAEAPS